jgi:hypothetical protein
MTEELFALTLHAPPPSEADYDVIYAAVMESERGRRFLTEYARRNRHADTQLLLGAINRIAVALRLQNAAAEPEPPGIAETPGDFEQPSLRTQLTRLIETIAKARAVLGTIEPEDARVGEAIAAGSGQAGGGHFQKTPGAAGQDRGGKRSGLGKTQITAIRFGQ